MRRHPNPRAEILVSPEIHAHLINAAVHTGFEKECWEIAAEAIEEWARRHNPDDVGTPATKGYQWKSLFLPDGTLLRTVFGGKNHHCVVENDSILYNGQTVSPSGFVNAVGGIRRNAWRSIWILLPADTQWKLANTQRVRPRPRRERKATQVAAQATAAHAGASAACADASPLARPLPEPAESIAAGTFEEPCAQPACQGGGQRTAANSERHEAQRRSASPTFSGQRRRGPERRAGGENIMPPLLQDALRTLLEQMITVTGERRHTRH
jgi:hypothetical protein